ncbi:glucosyl-3-phosphoglycerate synthase [Gordonia soli]|uniref:Glucosyl-3-phosphoglycerate synthase n=1 Tax=Gordonia soli NBRC 108243 TaxID=1223545 RepID=M0QL23_9ACTN|nr:glucosyl-3-phosphoglycerate synthase [Gordonia soli]GAC68981.1 glucosyl-3-phosphoglycerate synthase [Gordonia soli NBRC 108243]
MTIASMPDSATWLETNTWDRPDWTIDELVSSKRGRTISVVLPALNEEATVRSVVESIAPLSGSLIDEIVVVDSGSTDATIDEAIAAGARVETRETALPGVDIRPGKGEVLWRSLAATTGDIIVFVDSDLIDPDPMYVPNLVGPLLSNPDLHLVKGYYRRPFTGTSGVEPSGGGRVTELVVRPLVAALRPDLSGVIQPLAGEYAGTRELLTSVPFASGYGVEIGLVVDTVKRHGIDAIGQVNLGVRRHRNRPIHELGVMSRQIVATLLDRLGIEDSGSPLTQFVMEDGGHQLRRSYPAVEDRPAMNSMLVDPVRIASN